MNWGLLPTIVRIRIDRTRYGTRSMRPPEGIRAAVVGLGYWGPNLARNLNDIEGCELAWCCDPDDLARERWRSAFPAARFTPELDDVLGDPELDAVVVATPVSTHAHVAERVLAAGKHCFVEKPLAQDGASAERLISLADAASVTLMTGHLLEYHPGVEQLRALIESGELGDIRYVYSQRLNLGKLRSDENALWSLGAHDVSVVLALMRELPVAAWAQGQAFVRDGIEDVVFAYLRSRPVSWRICTSLGSIPTRRGGSRSWARSEWRRSTTWSWNAS